MAEGNQISLVNTRGRVVWVDESKVRQLREVGWRIIVNPKETYYPNFDLSAGVKVPEDQIGAATRVIENHGSQNVLGIIVI